MITADTSLGFDSIGTWLVSSSVVVAFMRFAKKRSSSGAIAWSPLATMYQDGFDFQATYVTLAPNADVAIGVWVAASMFASFTFTSQAKCFTMASEERLMKPCASTIGAANAGCGG